MRGEGPSQHRSGLAADIFVAETFASLMAEYRRNLQEAAQEIIDAFDELHRETEQIARSFEHLGDDTVPVVPVALDECWRCQTTIDARDDVGLCEPCKTELKEA